MVPIGKFKILLLTNDFSVIKNFILPMYYTLKNKEVFTVLYKFVSIRNFKYVKHDLVFLNRRLGYQAVLLPGKSVRSLLSILFEAKMPFHFVTGSNSGRQTRRIEVYYFLKEVYSWFRINYYKKISNNYLN